jgi:hypothetical protein
LQDAKAKKYWRIIKRCSLFLPPPTPPPKVLDLMYDGITSKSYDKKITMQNVLALAVLADKYDMAGLRGAVDKVMSDPSHHMCLEFGGHLEWLNVASRCGLKSAAAALMDKICRYGRPGLKSRSDLAAPNKRVCTAVDKMAPEDMRTLLLNSFGYRVE